MTRRRPPFTPEQIAIIRAMREAGAAWRAIGAATGRSHTGCQRYWIREIGGSAGWARLRGRVKPAAAPKPPGNRPALPAGSLSSWNALTAGTVIDGTTYQ